MNKKPCLYIFIKKQGEDYKICSDIPVRECVSFYNQKNSGFLRVIQSCNEEFPEKRFFHCISMECLINTNGYQHASLGAKAPNS